MYLYISCSELEHEVKNYIFLLAPISYFYFRFQSTEIPISATSCAP